jgi:transposase InsO family protein
LGHIIRHDSIRPAPSHIKAVVDFPQPENAKQLQRFLGIANYVRRFISHFSTTAAPLTQLLQKDAPFHWGSAQKEAFKALKSALTSEPVLKIFDPSLPVELYTDASLVGIGAVLMQDKHPIGYYSRKLNKHEANYTTSELECLAVVNAVEHFHVYLDGNKFIIFSDHSALQWLFKNKKPHKRLCRWAIHLSQYEYTIVHRPGKTLQHADALSRAPVFSESTFAMIASDNIRLTQQQEGMEPNNQQFIDENGVISFRLKGTVRQVVPKSLVPQLLLASHDNAGHDGINKCLKSLSRNYWWPGMKNDIRDHILSCHTCQIVKPSHHPTYGPLIPLESPTEPLALFAMDTIVMGSAAKNTKAKYIQVLIDHHSRYVWAKSTKTNTAAAAISVLDDALKSVKLAPNPRLLTDNGTNFRSKDFERYLKRHNIRHSFTSTYHPQTNGTNERVNGTIVTKLKLLRQLSPHRKWSTLLPEAIDIYNQSIHSTTGFTPRYLLFGLTEEGTTSSSLTEDRKMAVTRTEEFKRKKKELFDSKHKPMSLKVGDLVKKAIPTNHPMNNKLTPRFEGPFEVVSQESGVNYRIVKVGTQAPVTLVHVSQLDVYRKRRTQLQVRENEMS